jgi:hypothetical protein
MNGEKQEKTMTKARMKSYILVLKFVQDVPPKTIISFLEHSGGWWNDVGPMLFFFLVNGLNQ